MRTFDPVACSTAPTNLSLLSIRLSTVLRLTFALDFLPAPHNAFLFVPRIQRIPFFPLAYHPQLRQFSASPPAKPIAVRLLPLDTPAFYLRKSATAPSEAEAAQYWDAMVQAGAQRCQAGEDDWAVCWVPAPDDIGMKSGSLVSWETQLILIESSAAELSTETSPRPAASKLGPPPGTHAGRSLPAASGLASASRSATLANGWRELTSKSVRHFAPVLPSPPDSTEASSPSREIVFDEYEDLALSTSSYLDGVIKAREQERERLEAEKERERRRKEGGAQTPPTTEPTGSPEGSDDLWGSPPAAEPEEGRRPSATMLHLPAVSIPAQPTAPEPETMEIESAAPPPPPVPPPSQAPVFDSAEDAMDWSWDAPAGAQNGGLRAFGADPLSGLPDEPSWGGPEQVTEDDFDFFDSAPLGGDMSHHTFTDLPPVIHAPVDEIPPAVHDVTAAAAATTSSFVDPSFSLSPMPTFVAQDGGESAEFTLSQLMETDLTAPSPLDFATFNTEASGVAPTGASPHPATAPSPASWLISRTPKTPKTPFSPFIDVVEEEGSDDERALSPSAGGLPGLVQITASSSEQTEPVAPVGPLALFIPRPFQPVIFGPSHLEADEKYGAGKFSFATRRAPRMASALRATMPYHRTKPRPLASESVGRPSFKEFWARASTPEDDLPEVSLLLPDSGRRDLRELYDLASDPRIGVVGRIKQHLKRRTSEDVKRSGRPSKRTVSRSRDSAFFKSPPAEGVDQSDNDDDDEGSVIRPDGPHSTAGGPEIDVHLQSRKDEADPSIGRLLLAHLATGAFPADLVPLPSTFSRPSYAPPSISTPMPLSALTPGPMAASTPAWAPTPTSPPFLGPSLKDFSRDAVSTFTAWLLKEAVGSPNLPTDVLQAAAEELEPEHRTPLRLAPACDQLAGRQLANLLLSPLPPAGFVSDLVTASSTFKLGSGALSGLLGESLRRL